MGINRLTEEGLMDKRLFKVDSGDWLSSDKTGGEGRGSVLFSAPSWKGREDRITIRVVRSGKNMKAVSIKQLGVVINDIPTDILEYSISGGDKQILITTNASSLNALITSDLAVKGYIKAFTTASGLTIDVNDKKLDYGFPGDPGLKDVFQVSLIVSLPNNEDGDEVNENITINGVLIKIHQPGRFVPYIKLDKDFEQVRGDVTLSKLNISSNLDKYNIEIVECDQEEMQDITVNPDLVLLNNNGASKTVNITTVPKGLGWRISE